MKKAFRSFSEGLRKHQNTAAATYLAQVKSEKLIADMRGYDSVFDYLLAEQEVDRAMFDRQIDLIMKDFAPVAQKFLKHVAKVNGLEKMTFADWKLDLDSALNPDVTIDDAYDLVMKSVEPLGEEYSAKLPATKPNVGSTLLPMKARIPVVMQPIHTVSILMS